MDSRHTDWLNRKRDDPLERYREYVEFQLAVDGEGLGLRRAREDLADTGYSGGCLTELDQLAIASIMDAPSLNPALLEDDDTQALAKWWWHLGKLRHGSYPPEHLPEALRALYREALAHQAA